MKYLNLAVWILRLIQTEIIMKEQIKVSIKDLNPPAHSWDLNVYQILDLSKELLYVSVCKSVAKLQTIKVFEVTYFQFHAVNHIPSRPAVLQHFYLKKLTTVPCWKGLIDTDRHTKAQGCAGGFWVLHDTLKYP